MYAYPVSVPESPAASALLPGRPASAVSRGFVGAFALTWLSYASYYLGRKGIPIARSAIYERFGESSLKGVETVYLAMYAVGQFISGNAGDRIGARRLIGFGMLLSAAACIGFGFSNLIVLFTVAMFVNGLAQSTGWPGNVKAMAEWVPSQNRGRTMGIWATCYQVGGIAATGITARCLNAYGWRWAFIGPALGIGLVGVLVLLFLREGPLIPKGPASADPRPTSEGGAAAADPAAPALLEAQRAARRRVLRSFTVWSYGASYFCIKLIRYSFLFWLPYYLEKRLNYPRSDAGYLSTSFEIGGVFGTLALGALSDRLRHVPRSIVSAASLMGLAGAIYLYLQIGGAGLLANFLGMALVGVLLYGPDALLSGAAAQDAGGPLAAAMAAGVVNGLGSIGAVMQETVTRGVSDRWGWNALFYVFMTLSVLAAASLIPTFSGKGARAEEA